MSSSAREPTPITILNLPRWIVRTARSDRRRYRGSGRPMSARRLWRLLRPNLRRAVFIVGADRSGTTFLGDSLAAVPELSYHHEPVLTKAAGRYVYERRWSERRAVLLYRTTYAWLLRIHADGDLRLAEKTPSNSFILPFLARTFPDSRFVHIVRDGRDAVASHLKQPWLLAGSLATGRREPTGYRYGPDARFWVEKHRRAEFESTSDLARTIWSWRRHTEAALEGRTLGRTRYHELRYEELVNRPAEAGERLLDFLGIHTPASRAALLEALTVAESRSVGRWHDELGAEQLAEVEKEAGELLRELGYA